MKTAFSRTLRGLIVLLAVASLAACASGARSGAMTTSVDPTHLIEATSPLYMASKVDAVRGGSETNPLWKSNVSNEDFRTALEQSLKLNTLLADTNARYRIDVTLIDLDQPFAGFNITVGARVRYVVTPLAGGAAVFDREIDSSYTAKFGDALVAIERLRLANEGAIRTNIADFIKVFTASGAPVS